MPMSEACEVVRPLLSAFVDGELGEEEMEAVRRHLSVCRGCAALYEAEKQTKAILAEGYPKEFAPFELRSRIRRELDQAAGARQERPRSRRVWRPVWAFASAMAIILVAWLGFRALVVERGAMANGNVAHLVKIHGTIDCVNCYLARKYHVENYCKQFGHEPAFFADGGEIYHLVPNDLSARVQKDPRLMHTGVEISGWVFFQANAVELESIRPMEAVVQTKGNGTTQTFALLENQR